MTKTDDVTTPAIDTFVGKLNSAIDVVSEQLVKHAPEATEKLLYIVQLKAGAGILFAVFLLVMSLIIGFITFKKGLVPAFIDECKPYSQQTMEEGRRQAQVVLSAIVLAFSFIGVCIGFGSLFFFSEWLSVYDPVAGLAYKALLAAGVQL